jgi:hypothetical protein
MTTVSTSLPRETVPFRSPDSPWSSQPLVSPQRLLALIPDLLRSNLEIPTAGELKRTYLVVYDVASRPSNGLFFFLLSENNRSVFQS